MINEYSTSRSTTFNKTTLVDGQLDNAAYALIRDSFKDLHGAKSRLIEQLLKQSGGSPLFLKILTVMLVDQSAGTLPVAIMALTNSASQLIHVSPTLFSFHEFASRSLSPSTFYMFSTAAPLTTEEIPLTTIPSEIGRYGNSVLVIAL